MDIETQSCAFSTPGCLWPPFMLLFAIVQRPYMPVSAPYAPSTSLHRKIFYYTRGCLFFFPPAPLFPSRLLGYVAGGLLHFSATVPALRIVGKSIPGFCNHPVPLHGTLSNLAPGLVPKIPLIWVRAFSSLLTFSS